MRQVNSRRRNWQWFAPFWPGEVADLQSQRVRAAVLQSLVFSRDGMSDLPAFGARVTNGVIAGELNLDGCMADFPIMLSDVSFPDQQNGVSLSLRDAHLRRVILQNVELAGAIRADRASLDNGFICESIQCSGALSLSGARIGHTLTLARSQIGNGSGGCIAPGIRVEGPIILRDGKFVGQLVFAQADVSGGIFADRASIVLRHEEGTAPGRQRGPSTWKAPRWRAICH